MALRNCVAHNTWMQRKDNEGYLIQEWCSIKTNHEVFCRLCCKIISVRSKGFQALTQHAGTQEHKTNVKGKRNDRQLILTAQNSDTANNYELNRTTTIGMTFSGDAILKAELLWAIKTVHENWAAASCDQLGDLFRIMFPSDVVANKFKLARTKCGYLVTEALGPYFRMAMLKDIGSWNYTIMYDETVNAEKVKELQILVRYFSSSQNRIITAHLETFFISYADAENIVLFIRKAIDNANLPTANFVMLGSDGPNVNKKVFRLMSEKLKQERGWGLMDLGTCNIHTVHNAFLKGIKEFGHDVDDLIIQIYYFFYGWPVRTEDYKKIQIKEKVAQNKFIKHCATRWLTILPAADRLLEQWPGIIKYFLNYIPVKKPALMKSKRYETIASYLKQYDMTGQIQLVIESGNIFTKFTLLFQNDQPLVHVLYKHLKDLCLLIASRVCKNLNPNKLVDLFKDDNLLNIKNVKCSKIDFTCSEKNKLLFLRNVRDHYKAAGIHILEKTGLTYSILQDFKFLNPLEIPNKKSVDRIYNILKQLKFSNTKDIDIIDEFRLLQAKAASLPVYEPESLRIDEYWANILKNVASQSNSLQKFIFACLCVSHGNAEVERGFSRSELLLGEDKTAMSERTLNAKINIVHGLKLYHSRPDFVPITTELLKLGRSARNNYENYLSEKKKMEEEKERLAKEESTRKELEIKAVEELALNKRTIVNINSEMEEAKQQKVNQQKSADELLVEASNRLKTALKDKDLGAAQIAQGLIDGAMSIREQEKESEKRMDTLEKRKNSIITHYFAKKPKL